MMEEGAPECTSEEQGSTPPESACPKASSTHLVCYAFSQDGSRIVCGTTAGFRSYSTEPVCELRKRERVPGFHDRSVVLMATLFQTNIHAMVTSCEDDPGHGGLNKVRLWDDKQGKFIGELHSKYPVKGIAMRRDVIAVACEVSVRVYSCDELRPILVVDTAPNPKGLCVLAAASGPWMLCCPGQGTGTVQIHVGHDDTYVGQELPGIEFAAQRTAVAALALTESGGRIATASEMGTVVKVFQRLGVQLPTLIYRLRLSEPYHNQVISCVAFSPDDSFLAAALSSSPVVHLFRLEADAALSAEQAQRCPPDDLPLPPQPPVERESSSGLWGRLTGAVKGAVPDYFSDTSSIARFLLPEVQGNGRPLLDTRAKHARISGPLLAFHRTEPRLTVVHYNGMLYDCSFRRSAGPNEGTQEYLLKAATVWFAVRPDFRMQRGDSEVRALAGAAGDTREEDEGDEWRLL